MNCPRCKTQMKKARLDVYWCHICLCAWLIHKLSTYKTFEEASKTRHQELEQLKQDFLSPLIYDATDSIILARSEIVISPTRE